MAIPGTKPKPHLAVVKSGNPGKRPIKPGAKYAPTDLIEPKWTEYFPSQRRAEARARKTASELWCRTAPVLQRSAGLVDAQREVLIDYCVTWARIQMGERELSLHGPLVNTERGQVKNGWVTILNQYRSHFRSLIGELGLSPSAATRIDAGGADDDDGEGVLD